MAFSDWYELIDQQSISGQILNNVYHVERAAPTVTAETIVQAFRDTVLDVMLPLQTVGLKHELVSARSLDDPLDFFSVAPVPGDGTLVGLQLSSYIAATIQFNRLRTDMKNGQKRFFVGSESELAANFWVGGFLPLIAALGDAILTTWEETSAPGVAVCSFGILKRVCIVQPPPVPCPGYRLPENDAELIFYIPITAAARPTVRSQVSRKQLN